MSKVDNRLSQLEKRAAPGAIVFILIPEGATPAQVAQARAAGPPERGGGKLRVLDCRPFIWRLMGAKNEPGK